MAQAQRHGDLADAAGKAAAGEQQKLVEIRHLPAKSDRGEAGDDTRQRIDKHDARRLFDTVQMADGDGGKGGAKRAGQRQRRSDHRNAVDLRGA